MASHEHVVEVSKGGKFKQWTVGTNGLIKHASILPHPFQSLEVT